jgi:hypothetical protein
VEACEASTSTWKGEIGTNTDAQKPFERLSYHPQFATMVAEIRRFLDTDTAR